MILYPRKNVGIPYLLNIVLHPYSFAIQVLNHKICKYMLLGS